MVLKFGFDLANSLESTWLIKKAGDSKKTWMVLEFSI